MIMDFPERPIFDQYPEWKIEPVQPVGWSASQTTGDHVHVIGAPTLIELRAKLQEVCDREARA